MPIDARSNLTAAIARISGADPALAEELAAVRDAVARRGDESAAFLESAPQDSAGQASGLALETIVLRVGRPVLAIVDDRPRLEFSDAESEVWRSRIRASIDVLARAAKAVGRIDVSGHPQLQWVGTGWLVDVDTIVTNRHVAREFARRSGERYVFTSAAGTTVSASVDFLKEVDRSDRREFRIVGILHIEDEPGPDLALLRVEAADANAGLGEPIALSRRGADAGRQVAVIGYPARDSRIPDYALMQSIFGDVYDRKRLSPGQVIEGAPSLLTHDCSTLGGNSGSVVLDLEDGTAVGLHFAGRFLQANHAVPAALVLDRLNRLRKQGSAPSTSDVPQTNVPGMPSPTDPPPAAWPMPASGTRPRPADEDGEPEADSLFVEGVPSDYVGRPGYDPVFLGVDVPLPVMANVEDRLEFSWGDEVEHVLRYQHFSVVMSRSRRLCVFSATNLDGGLMRRLRRPGWRLDPRIPTSQQIRGECYGNPPRFSRGHMTRRTDPVWGDAEAATRANVDSMHVTNTVPQLQPFNAGIWLGLEDYALDHAVEDAMRISVLTGPFLLDDDPVRFGVSVPRSFWKVIVFIHDETRKLSATGYVMSQERLLGGQEFVFGAHQTWQVPVSSIERRAGLSFGNLAAVDPLADVEEAASAPLTDVRQIRWGAR